MSENDYVRFRIIVAGERMDGTVSLAVVLNTDPQALALRLAAPALAAIQKRIRDRAPKPAEPV